MDVKRQLFEACAGGHLATLKTLLDNHSSLVSISSTNDNKNSLLHVAASFGHVDLMRFLCANNDAMIDARNGLSETALHEAAKHGHQGATAFLLQHNCDINAQNDRRSTALHLACQKRQPRVALLLLQFQCRTDLEDVSGETALHVACREDLLSVTQALCSSGCNVEHQNKARLTPLLIAARFSSAELVRCLLLSGADIDTRTTDGVNASDIALANGRSDVSDLLQKLTATLTNDRLQACISQLLPTKRHVDCVRVNVLGFSATGKTSLLEALKCGYVQSLLRRSGAAALLSVVARRSTPLSTTTKSRHADHKTHACVGKNKQWSWQDTLRQPPSHDGYTRGIDIQQASISGAGYLSFWEFSGYEPYLLMYDQFIGDPNCIYVVVVSMKDSSIERKRQLHFWLDYLRCHMTFVEPIGFAGCKLWAPRVILVATHADLACKDHGGVQSDPEGLVTELQRRYETDLIIEPHMFVVDSSTTSSSEMNALKRALGDIKKFICEYLPPETGLLQPAVKLLSDWCRVLSAFPVVTWSSFVDYIRSRVNLLATEQQVRELVHQLVVIGEAVFLKKGDDELVVLDPEWLGADVIGQLLSESSITDLPLDGRVSTDQLRSVCPESPPLDLVRLLAVMDVCAPLDPDLDNDVIFACLDRSTEPSLQVRQNLVNGCEHKVYGGCKLKPDHPQQLVYLFPRIMCALRQTVLRRSATSNLDTVSGSGVNAKDTVDRRYEVRQWSKGVQIIQTTDELTVTVRLHSKPTYHLMVVCCAPPDQRSRIFFLQESLCESIYMTVDMLCPGLQLERSPLSASHLALGVSRPHAYKPRDVVLAQLAGTNYLLADSVNVAETLLDLITFGDAEVFSHLKPGLEMSVRDLPVHVRYQLAAALDHKDSEGRDWSALAAAVGLADRVPPVDEDHSDEAEVSRLDVVLDAWATDADATVKDLHVELVKLGRTDAVETLLSFIPLFRYH